MKILLVSGPGIYLKEPYNSGIEAFMVSFANQLVDEGHTVDIVAEEAEINSKFKLINPFSATADNDPYIRKKPRETHQFSKMNVDSYDVIHFNMFYPHLLKAGMHFKKMSFLTLHSPADPKRISVYKELSCHSDLKFVAISKRVKSQYDQELNMNIPLINNGIDTGLWPALISREPEYLLWSARITKEKNVVAAIRVAQHMHLSLKIAGRIADQNYFDEQVKPHLNSQIQYVGHVTQRELNNLSKKAYAYLATATWQEPFGLAALEMLASGVPVVGFNTAVPQSWEHESVLTTSSLQWQDLVELVEKSKAVSPASCKDFASNMTLQKMTSDYLKLYSKALTSEAEAGEKSLTEDHLLKPTIEHTQSSK